MEEAKKERNKKSKELLLELKRKKWVLLREEYFKKLGKEHGEQFGNPQDVGDLSLLDLIEDTGLKVADIHKDELIRIEEALLRLDQGKYGLCEECGNDIDGKRLTVMPFVTLCVECQRKKEPR
ncbi:MAG: TraR/DksA C4-type zinc finger protein [Deltaproteobacteria bacterium]|nr:TraR/DksA C4-type zinc finger protein [Deltaproteobacteria bacterium]